MKASVFKALAVLAAVCLMSGAASAQTAGPASFSTNVRTGGAITGATGTTWSWNVPAGQYLAVARVTYALQSTRTDSGGGVSALRCRLHQPTGGFLDIGQASIGATATTAMNSGGELTLISRLSLPSGPGVLSVTCDAAFANARSSQRVESLRIELIQVSSFTNLTPAS